MPAAQLVPSETPISAPVFVLVLVCNVKVDVAKLEKLPSVASMVGAKELHATGYVITPSYELPLTSTYPPWLPSSGYPMHTTTGARC